MAHIKATLGRYWGTLDLPSDQRLLSNSRLQSNRCPFADISWVAVKELKQTYHVGICSHSYGFPNIVT